MPVKVQTCQREQAWEQAGKESKSLLPCPSVGFQQKVEPRLKVTLPSSKDLDLEVGLPTFNGANKEKIPNRCA